MELIMIISALVVSAMLAARYGYDSRESIYSKDQEFASYGVTWDEHLHQQELAAEVNSARALRLTNTLEKAA